jgi:hypothetical protein
VASVLIQLVDAVVTAVNAAGWSGESFTAVKSYAEADSLLSESSAESLQVEVLVPEGYDDVELESRGLVTRTATVEVVIRKRFGMAAQESSGRIDPDDIDPLVELAELLAESVIYDRMTGLTAAAWIESQNDPVYRRDHLREHRQFTSVVLLTFEISSAI